MSQWGHRINQWSVWQRCLFMLLIILALHVIWYMSLEKPLLQRWHDSLARQASYKKLARELSIFSQMQENFVYKSDVGFVQLRQVFQDILASSPGMSIVHYADNPVVTLSAGAALFPGLQAVLNLALLNRVQQFSATVLFSGTFEECLLYLKALQHSSHAIYFESINFYMNRYPKAEITMKVFTLEG